MRYQKIILIVILSLSSHFCYACSCSGITTFFNSISYSEDVVEGKVLEHKTLESTAFNLGYSVVLFQINKVYNGATTSRDTIMIAESTGYECYSSHFENGKNYFVQGELTRLMEVDLNGYVDSPIEILFPASCAESTLLIDTQKKEVCGKISKNTDRWYSRLLRKLKKKKKEYRECLDLSKFRKKLLTQEFKNHS